MDKSGVGLLAITSLLLFAVHAAAFAQNTSPPVCNDPVSNCECDISLAMGVGTSAINLPPCQYKVDPKTGLTTVAIGSSSSSTTYVAAGMPAPPKGSPVPSTAIVPIDAWNYCRWIDNTGSNSYFIPFKTETEWTSFINNAPSDLKLVHCARPYADPTYSASPSYPLDLPSKSGCTSSPIATPPIYGRSQTAGSSATVWPAVPLSPSFTCHGATNITSRLQWTASDTEPPPNNTAVDGPYWNTTNFFYSPDITLTVADITTNGTASNTAITATAGDMLAVDWSVLSLSSNSQANVASCVGTSLLGDWSWTGNISPPLSNSVQLPSLGKDTYTLTCTDPSTSLASTITVTVNDVGACGSDANPNETLPSLDQNDPNLCRTDSVLTSNTFKATQTGWTWTCSPEKVGLPSSACNASLISPQCGANATVNSVTGDTTGTLCIVGTPSTVSTTDGVYTCTTGGPGLPSITTTNPSCKATVEATTCVLAATSMLNITSPYPSGVPFSYLMVGGGGGGYDIIPPAWCGGGGGGSSAIIANGGNTYFASGGSGGSLAHFAGFNGNTANGNFTLSAGSGIVAYVGGGGGGGGTTHNSCAGGGGSGWFGGGGGGISNWSGTTSGGGGSNVGGSRGIDNWGYLFATSGSSKAGGNSEASESYGGMGPLGGGGYGGGGGGGYGGGGGGGNVWGPAGGNSGTDGGGNYGGLGANDWASNATMSLPAAAGKGGASDGGSTVHGGNAGFVLLEYSSPTGICMDIAQCGSGVTIDPMTGNVAAGTACLNGTASGISAIDGSYTCKTASTTVSCVGKLGSCTKTFTSTTAFKIPAYSGSIGYTILAGTTLGNTTPTSVSGSFNPNAGDTINIFVSDSSCGGYCGGGGGGWDSGYGMPTCWYCWAGDGSGSSAITWQGNIVALGAGVQGRTWSSGSNYYDNGGNGGTTVAGTGGTGGIGGVTGGKGSCASNNVAVNGTVGSSDYEANGKATRECTAGSVVLTYPPSGGCTW